ncbi:MAG TPA: hypothetical protein VGP65_14720 [Candidatus Angelobacter sp.]|nr:hypothetical protein [Candidatus Angelobacter sp.]
MRCFFLCCTLPAQTVPHATGVAHIEQVDLAYEIFGGASLLEP